ncbi:MAG TPA: D-alanyl-D-alanine carboxypeptidase/D-alanyl-D-alanine-endopeptidase [Burkholderiales bacterium]|nr:D-alanyl-D-alanine carboxypeptidase/D-alanyl-D-alanine-endopeptidase [Burkholderiales bacterium]
MKGAYAARLCCAGLVGLALISCAGAAALPGPVAQALASGGIPASSVALYVHDIGAEKPAISHGSELALNPASTMKLVTTYAALEMLGPAFTWNTEVYAAGSLQNDVLAGDLIVKGYGDPKLTLENFWLLLRNVRARGVREIRGDVLLDRSYFSAEDFDPARFDGDPIRPYNTGPDALLVNFKAITVQFVPEPASRSVRLIVEPPLEAVQVVNHVSLVDGACDDWVAKLKFEPQGSSEAARLVVSGTYARDCGERTRSFSLLGHRAYVAALFAQLWKEIGGTVTGTVRDGQAPAGARTLTSARSPAVSEIVRDINKYSNNVMARQLFLTLGASGSGAPGTMAKARQVIRQWLAQKGLAMPELVMENGSGLSRMERISARSMGEMLLDAFHSPVMPEFIASLPIVAADGTMRKRLPNAQVAGQAHIKGGTLTGVRAIAGYVLDARGRRVVVVFIVNHPNAANAHAAQDALLKWVHGREEAGRAPRALQRAR